MVSALRRQATTLDRIFLHVGGGALAASVIEGLRESYELGVLDRMPRIHAVQTEGAYPLVRAFDLLSRHILERWTQEAGGSITDGGSARARELAMPELASLVTEGLHHAASHRSEFMWPWEQEPQSIADGILDDETYDWLAVAEGMLETGGWPLIVSEDLLRRANSLVREATDLTPCHTGTAGLAGVLACRAELGRDERVAILVTGIERDSPKGNQG
jgi:threonine synthase